MILDHLDHAGMYEAVHPLFGKAFAFLREHQADDLPVGRYEICDGVYAMVQNPALVPVEQGKWEAHRQYIDIQYLKTGAEGIGIAPLSSLTETVPYSPEKDIAFYAGEGSLCRVSQGEYMILYPHDAHMPLIQMPGTPSQVVKIVVKVRLQG